MRNKRFSNLRFAPGFIARGTSKRSAADSVDHKLERAKSIATIFSAIAIPIVLTVAGYFIQNQLASEGIRKDYVGIATAILKERPDGQEPEIRAWAVKILDENAPIPFSKKAREGLLTGTVVSAGPAWMGPPEDCRKPPAKRNVIEQYKKLAKDSRTLDGEKYMKRLIDFANIVVDQEEQALITAANLSCMQEWASIMEKSDIDFRNAIGAPSSKSIIEEMNAKAVH